MAQKNNLKDKAVNCTFESRRPTDGTEQPCLFDINVVMEGTPCSPDENFGFPTGKPCILLKLNKIFNWQPKPFANSEFREGDTDQGDPRKDVPEALKKMVRQWEETGTPEQKAFVGRTVWVHCEGENPADREAIGPIDYYPAPGWPDYYFPYKKNEFYLQPIVFAHFQNPQSKLKKLKHIGNSLYIKGALF